MNNVAGFEFAPLQVKAGRVRKETARTWVVGGSGCGRVIMEGDTHRNLFITPNYKGLIRSYKGHL